jgi:NDP-sugar pyrophosphorylase family protein
MPNTIKEYGGILLCGGRGKRLESINGSGIPKSLFKVADQELIRYSIDALPSRLVGRLVFAVGYRAEDIKTWTNEINLPHKISFSEQTKPGVLGAIAAGAQHIREDSMVACNTDEIRVGLSLANILSFHERQGTLATMATTYSDRLSRHRLIESRPDGIITRTELKPEKYEAQPGQIGLVNTGFLVIEKQAMDYFDAGHSNDWSGIIDPLCEAGQLSAFVNPDIRYFNVGTPKEFQEAEGFLEQHSSSTIYS